MPRKNKADFAQDFGDEITNHAEPVAQRKGPAKFYVVSSAVEESIDDRHRASSGRRFRRARLAGLHR